MQAQGFRAHRVSAFRARVIQRRERPHDTQLQAEAPSAAEAVPEADRRVSSSPALAVRITSHVAQSKPIYHPLISTALLFGGKLAGITSDQ